MYKVFRTQRADKELAKQLTSSELQELEVLEKKQLTKNPYVGDPLGYSFFREKKLAGKRVYYLIYNDIKSVLIVGVSNKKSQQETINEIKSHLKTYYSTIEK